MADEYVRLAALCKHHRDLGEMWINTSVTMREANYDTAVPL